MPQGAFILGGFYPRGLMSGGLCRGAYVGGLFSWGAFILGGFYPRGANVRGASVGGLLSGGLMSRGLMTGYEAFHRFGYKNLLKLIFLNNFSQLSVIFTYYSLILQYLHDFELKQRKNLENFSKISVFIKISVFRIDDSSHFMS